MKVEYGQIKEYKTKKGYGFVTRTFDNTIRQNIRDRDVFFHITAIKNDFPDLAQQLSDGLGTGACFWYLIDTSERDKVEKIWLDINDIPEPYQKDLFSYIERLSNQLPPLLEQINNICLATEKHKEQTPISNQLKLRETNKTKPLEIEAKKVDVHKIELEKSELEKEQTDKIIRDEKYYAGLPEDLINSVFWVGREFRRNPLSHQPGGCNLIIEYQDGRILEYDWIKQPSYYINKAIYNQINHQLGDYQLSNHKFLSVEDIMEISREYFKRIFVKQYTYDGLSSLPFEEAWNSHVSNTTPEFALSRFNYSVSQILSVEMIKELIKKSKRLKEKHRNKYYY